MNRKVYIDVIKIIAIICVIMCHIPILWNIDMMDEGLPLWWYIVNSLGILGVPLFMMSTGALILNKELNTRAGILRFYCKNTLTIYVTGTVWCVLYYITKTEHISFSDIIKTVCLINKPEVHLWYIRMVIIYYLAMPVIVYLHKNHIRLFIVLTAIIAIVTFGWNLFLILFEHTPAPTTSGLSLSCYIVYMAVGYHCAVLHGNVIRGKILMALAGAVSMTILVVLRYNNWFRFMWYDNPFVMVAAICIFSSVKELFKDAVRNDLLADMSNMIFGVYLCHVMFMYPMMEYVQTNINPSLPAFLVVELSLLVISFSVVKVSGLFPSLSKLLFRY